MGTVEIFPIVGLLSAAEIFPTAAVLVCVRDVKESFAGVVSFVTASFVDVTVAPTFYGGTTGLTPATGAFIALSFR